MLTIAQTMVSQMNQLNPSTASELTHDLFNLLGKFEEKINDFENNCQW